MDVNPHEKIDHDSIDWLGYDWEKVANSRVQPSPPLAAYFPRSTAEVITAVKSFAAKQQPFLIRGSGHSDNGLILGDRNTPVLCTKHLDSIGKVDTSTSPATIEVGAGARLSEIDETLSRSTPTLGLPIVPDHFDISVGGYLSVGGLSAASHKHGLFVDNIESIELIRRDGSQTTLKKNAQGFKKVMASCGRFGVITKAKLRVIRIDKKNTIYASNTKPAYATLDSYVSDLLQLGNAPSNVAYQRGIWRSTFRQGAQGLEGSGLITTFARTAPSQKKWRQLTQDNQHLRAIGLAAGTLTGALEPLEIQLKQIGISALLQGTKYATAEGIESFTDNIIDATVPPETSMITALVPAAAYKELITKGLKSAAKLVPKGLVLSTAYSRLIRSPYLQGPATSPMTDYFDLTFLLGTINSNNAGEIRDVFTKELDASIEKFNDGEPSRKAYRYLSTKTTFRPESGDKRDPNSIWS